MSQITQKEKAPLKIGVVGLGLQGQKHLRNFSANHKADIRAVCDLDQQRLSESAEAFNVPNSFLDYRDLIKCDEVEAVAVVLPDHMHRDAAVAALTSGKHLLLEKPMAIAVEDAEAMAEAARRSSSCFMLNHSNRWMYPFARGKQLLDSGEVGALRYIFARMANRIVVPTELLPWLKKSHPAHWIGVHRLDIARWWAGSEVARVRGVQRYGVLRERGYEAPDFFQATIEFRNDVVMSLEVNWILPPDYPITVDSKFFALCSNGVIDVDRARSELMIGKSDSFDLSTPADGASLDQTSGFTFAASRHFVDCALNDTNPLIGAEDGLALTKALCAIVESCENDGKVIELESSG